MRECLCTRPETGFKMGMQAFPGESQVGILECSKWQWKVEPRKKAKTVEMLVFESRRESVRPWAFRFYLGVRLGTAQHRARNVVSSEAHGFWQTSPISSNCAVMQTDTWVNHLFIYTVKETCSIWRKSHHQEESIFSHACHATTQMLDENGFCCHSTRGQKCCKMHISILCREELAPSLYRLGLAEEVLFPDMRWLKRLAQITVLYAIISKSYQGPLGRLCLSVRFLCLRLQKLYWPLDKESFFHLNDWWLAFLHQETSYSGEREKWKI